MKTQLSYKPIVLCLKNKKDKKVFKQLTNQSQLEIFDSIKHQVKELIKIQNVGKQFSKKKLNELIIKEIGKDSKKYGLWIYYPWRNQMVHLLNKKDFITVRTNRNKLKITEKEQKILSKKIIGIVGLSVGQSVALTLAMERGFKELKIADFDTIDLSNLNRIRTGVMSLGLPKTIIVAREIAEIDPFLKVTLFNNGLTEDNMQKFLKGLDVLIDECDSLDLKIKMRIEAKKQQIPVLMDTSDRGLLDVERFDLQPNRSIMHGLIEGLDVNNVKDLSNEEKIPYALAMVGGDAISNRLKESMNQVGKTISTWPQLAADVVAGGGHTAHVCRKICLGKKVKSGRYYIDLDELI